jgi:glycosyltransferase involved in cell wall biosynthesis
MDNSAIRLPSNGCCKRVSTIHDLIVYKHPEYFTKKHGFVVRRMIAHSVKNSDHIIADSISTRNDILDIFPKTDETKISVVYLGASSNFKQCADIDVSTFLGENGLPERYFLSLATHEPRKNLKNLINAFRLLKQNSAYEDIGLVLVGGQGWLDSGVDTDRESLEKEKIFPLGFLKDEDLPLVYSGALAFVYPSFYEGFGLPILEAMSCGCSIITSDNSSLPEVAGESAVYVDPCSIESIRQALQDLADNKEQREKLAEAAFKRSQMFSWDETARQTEDIYLNVLEAAC